MEDHAEDHPGTALDRHRVPTVTDRATTLYRRVPQQWHQEIEAGLREEEAPEGEDPITVTDGWNSSKIACTNKVVNNVPKSGQVENVVVAIPCVAPVYQIASMKRFNEANSSRASSVLLTE